MTKLLWFAKVYRNLIILLLSLFNILLVMLWVPGLGATIMMSDSFVVNDPRVGLLMILLLIWGTLPITLIASFVLFYKKKQLLYYSLPLFQLLIFFIISLTFTFFDYTGIEEQHITESQQHDLNLILGR